MPSLHRAFWWEFTAIAIQQLNSLEDLCPRLTEPADFCCSGHVEERRAVTKPSKLLCHLIEDLLHKLTPPSSPLLPLGLWSTVWARGSWARPLSVGAPSRGRKEGVDKSHTDALYYLQPLSQPGVGERSWGTLPSLPAIVHMIFSLFVSSPQDVSLFEFSGKNPACWLASSVLRRYLTEKKRHLTSHKEKLVAFPYSLIKV